MTIGTEDYAFAPRSSVRWLAAAAALADVGREAGLSDSDMLHDVAEVFQQPERLREALAKHLAEPSFYADPDFSLNEDA